MGNELFLLILCFSKIGGQQCFSFSFKGWSEQKWNEHNQRQCMDLISLLLSIQLGKTALILSCLHGKYDAMITLLEAGAGTECQDHVSSSLDFFIFQSGKTVLSHAISKYDARSVEALIKAGANVFALDPVGIY